MQATELSLGILPVLAVIFVGLVALYVPPTWHARQHSKQYGLQRSKSHHPAFSKGYEAWRERWH